MKITQRSL